MRATQAVEPIDNIHVRKMRVLVRWLGVIAILILASLIASQRGTNWTDNRPPFPLVVHRGFTNDGAGTKMALFVVTNASGSTWVRNSRYWLQVPYLPSRRAGKTVRQGNFVGGAGTLRPGQFETVFVPVPTNGDAWQLCIVVRRDESQIRAAARNLITKPADQLGFERFGDKFRNFDLGLSSDWVEP